MPQGLTKEKMPKHLGNPGAKAIAGSTAGGPIPRPTPVGAMPRELREEGRATAKDLSRLRRGVADGRSPGGTLPAAMRNISTRKVRIAPWTAERGPKLCYGPRPPDMGSMYRRVPYCTDRATDTGGLRTAGIDPSLLK